MSLIIFAEGTDQDYTDPQRKKNWHIELWRLLVTKCCGAEPSGLYVVGFSKDSIKQLRWTGPGASQPDIWLGTSRSGEEYRHPLRPRPKGARDAQTDQTMDVLIDRKIKHIEGKAPGCFIDRVIIALDLKPKHDALKSNCLRAELFLVLEDLAQSKHLATRFRDACRMHMDRLRRWPREQPRTSRTACLEILVMDPLFEDFLLADPRGFRRALGHERDPSGDWPSFSRTSDPAEHIFKPACRLASPAVHAKLQDKKCDDKARWAHYILRQLDEDSKVWSHDIFTRLQSMLRA